MLRYIMMNQLYYIKTMTKRYKFDEEVNDDALMMRFAIASIENNMFHSIFEAKVSEVICYDAGLYEDIRKFMHVFVKTDNHNNFIKSIHKDYGRD